MPEISHIAIYPIKGCAGIDIGSAFLTRSGLTGDTYRDHGFMVVSADPDSDGRHRFVTQRDSRDRTPQGFADMSLVKPSLLEYVMTLSWNGEDAIYLPHDIDRGKELVSYVWDDTFNAVD